MEDLRKLHEIENFDTKTIVNEMMRKFYDYIVAAELVENSYTTLPYVNTENIPLYLNEETVGGPRNASRGGDILIERVE